MKRILVTGAQGFIGRYVVAALLAGDSKRCVLGIGRSPLAKDTFTHSVGWASHRLRAPLKRELITLLNSPQYQYESIDLSCFADVSKSLSAFRPEWIIHLASGLRGDDPQQLVRINVEGTVNLMEAVGRENIDCQRIIMASSGGVYGIPPNNELPLHECMSCRPLDIYSSSKLAAEDFSRILARTHSIPIIWARIFNVVGPGQDERHVCGKYASQAAMIRMQKAPAEITVENLDTTRDFIDVRDVADAIIALCQSGNPGCIYNVASGCETRIGQILDWVLSAAQIGQYVSVQQGPTRTIDVPRHVGDIAALRSVGFEPRRTLRDSIQDVVDYYLNSVASAAALDTSIGTRPSAESAGNLM